MPGLIQQNMSNDPLQNVTGYDPAQITVDPTKETVAGQIKTITAENSPLMMQARTAAKQTAAKTGLLNSSMAAGAGEKAVIQTALPIAQQDAGTYFQASRDNKDAKNAAYQFGAGEKNQFAQQQLSGQQQLQQIDKQGEWALKNTQAQGSVQSGLAYQQSLYDKNMQVLRGDQQMELERIASDNRLLLQNNNSAGQIMNTAMSQIGAILANPDMDEAAKQSQVAQINALLKDQLLVLGKTIDLDLGGVLNGTGPAVKTNPYIPPATPIYRPPAVPAVTPLANQINAIHQTATDELQALGQMYQSIQSAGYTKAADVAQALGISEQMVRTELAKIGATLA